MKRQAEWKYEGKCIKRIIPMKRMSEKCNVFIKKIEILKNEKDSDIRNNTQDKKEVFVGGIFCYFLSKEKIDGDEEKQYEDVLRHECHIEITTRGKEQIRTKTSGQKPVQGEDERKEHQEAESIKKHSYD
jgi:hypothetical protein